MQGGTSTAAAVLGWTESLVVGIGLLPIPLRNVGLTAMEVASLSRMFPGRSRVAVGHGVQAWMRQVGSAARSPMGLMAEHVPALRALLRGEVVHVDGEFVQLDGVQLDWPPSPAPAILVGAVGPKTLALAGRLADGLVLTADLPVASIHAAVCVASEARERSGVVGPLQVVAYMRAFTGPHAKRHLAEDLEAAGLSAVDPIGAAGNADDVASAVQEVFAAGASSVVLQPGLGVRDMAPFMEFTAEVQALLPLDSSERSRRNTTLG